MRGWGWPDPVEVSLPSCYFRYHPLGGMCVCVSLCVCVCVCAKTLSGHHKAGVLYVVSNDVHTLRLLSCIAHTLVFP